MENFPGCRKMVLTSQEQFVAALRSSWPASHRSGWHIHNLPKVKPYTLSRREILVCILNSKWGDIY